MARSFFPPAQVAKVRRQVEGGAFPDTCEIRRETSSGEDEFGNALPPTTTTVEMGPCGLRRTNAQRSSEHVVASRLGWDAPYSIDLPTTTIAMPADTIRVNSTRTFHVGGLVEEGEWALMATAVCEERG